MKINLITLFPESVEGYLNSSMIKRARERGILDVQIINPRDFSKDKHKKADDRPYGGGPGMVMLARPILDAVDSTRKNNPELRKKTKVVVTSPGGKQFTNSIASKWAKKYKNIIFVCGHYEGIDARVKKALRAEEYSIGPYVITGGELPALVMTDSVARRIPGVLGKEKSIEENRLSCHEVYTRPEILEYKSKKYKVPKILLSGHRKNIDLWKEGLTNDSVDNS